jgi:threonine dehydrogenase-like Zn-dependent dehydrogenase
MRAVTWQGAKDIRVERVPDPEIETDSDIVIRVTSTRLCGSDLHLYEVLAPFMEPGEVYGGAAAPLPMIQMFDKQVQIRMGQANVRTWTDDILALLNKDEDVLGVESFATHHLSLDEAPDAYETFQKKQDGAVKMVFRP